MLNSYQLLSSDIVDGYLTNNKGMVAQRGLETRECPSKWPWLWVGFTRCCLFPKFCGKAPGICYGHSITSSLFTSVLPFLSVRCVHGVCAACRTCLSSNTTHTHNDSLSCTDTTLPCQVWVMQHQTKSGNTLKEYLQQRKYVNRNYIKI